MKREDWQRVYQPRQGALEARVGQTLRMLDTRTTGRTWAMKKTMALALAAVLLLGAAAALAAGLIFSDQVDAKTAARQALAEQYGFTPAMESFFDCKERFSRNSFSSIFHDPWRKRLFFSSFACYNKPKLKHIQGGRPWHRN